MKNIFSIIKLSIFSFGLLITINTQAQMNPGQLITDVRELDLNAMTYDPANPKIGKGFTLSYADVEGSAFWNDNWYPAILFFSNGEKAKINQAKLNLYSNEIHYLSSDGTELVVNNEGITRLVFLNKTNLTQPISSFAKLANHVSGKGTAYYKVLNAGPFQLILLQKQLIKTSPYDPLQGKRVSSFFTKKDYAIYNEGKVFALDDLNRKSLIASFNNEAHFEQLLKENKTKLKSEKEVTDFLEAYNAAVGKK